jgi:hypothetical protein
VAFSSWEREVVVEENRARCSDISTGAKPLRLLMDLVVLVIGAGCIRERKTRRAAACLVALLLPRRWGMKQATT